MSSERWPPFRKGDVVLAKQSGGNPDLLYEAKVEHLFNMFYGGSCQVKCHANVVCLFP